MPFEFLHQHGAKRMRDYQSQPMMLSPDEVNGATLDSEEEHDLGASGKARKIDLSFEEAPEKWRPIRVSTCGEWQDFEEWPLRPQRFIDGKDVGRTVAWLKTPEGYPVPLRLSIIGAISMRNDGGRLTREWQDVQRVLTMAVDCFPNGNATEFADDLASARDQIRLRAVPCPAEGLGFDFERNSDRTRSESRKQMNELEKQALRFDEHTPTLVDGRLDSHNGAFSPELSPVLALIKSHHVEYFAGNMDCWRTLYTLEPGERTPAFVLQKQTTSFDIVSWYLRLCGTNGEMPNWGVVRLEVAKPFFDSLGEEGRVALDGWSRLICEYRCRDNSYGRSAVSIHPIVRAEQSLGEVFTSLDTLVHRFYRLTGL